MSDKIYKNTKEHYVLSLLYKSKNKFNLCLDEINDELSDFFVYSNPNTNGILLKLNDKKYVVKLNDLWQITNNGIDFIEKNGTCSWDIVKPQWLNIRKNKDEIDIDKKTVKNIIFELRNISDIRTFISKYTKCDEIIEFILNFKITSNILSSIKNNDNISDNIIENSKKIYEFISSDYDIEKMFSEKMYINLYFSTNDDIKQKICLDNIFFKNIDDICNFIKSALNSEVIIKIIGKIQNISDKDDVIKILSSIPNGINDKIILLALLNSSFCDIVKEVIKSKGIEEKDTIEFDYIFNENDKEINIYNNFYYWANISNSLEHINIILDNAKKFASKDFKNKIQERLYVSLCEKNIHSIKDEYVPIVLSEKTDKKILNEVSNYLSILLDDKIEEYNIDQIPNYIEINLTNNLKYKSFKNFAHFVLLDDEKDNTIFLHSSDFLIRQINNFDIKNIDLKINQKMGSISCKPLFVNDQKVIVITNLCSDIFEYISSLQSKNIEEVLDETSSFIKDKLLPICKKMSEALKAYDENLDREEFIKKYCGKIEIKFLKAAYDNMIIDNSFDTKIDILLEKCNQIENLSESEELRNKLIEIIKFLISDNNNLVVNKDEIKYKYYYDLIFNDEKKKILDLIQDWDKILITYLCNYAKNINAKELWFPPDSIANNNLLRKQIYEQNVIRLLTANNPDLYDPIFDNFVIGINLDNDKNFIREKLNNGFISTEELKLVFNDEINQYIDKISNMLLEKIDLDKFLDNINYENNYITTEQLLNYLNNSEYSNYLDSIKESIDDFKETVIDDLVLNMNENDVIYLNTILDTCGDDINSRNKILECANRLGNSALYYANKNKYGLYDINEIINNIKNISNTIKDTDISIGKIKDTSSRLRSSIFDILCLNKDNLSYDEMKEKMEFAGFGKEFGEFIAWYRNNKPLNNELKLLKENLKNNINLNEAIKIAPLYEDKIRRVKDWYSNISKNITFKISDFEKLISLEDNNDEIIYGDISIDKIKEYDIDYAKICKKRFLNEKEFEFVEKNTPSIIPQYEWDKKEIYWLRAQLPNNIKNKWSKFDLKYLLERFNKINKNNWNLEDVEKIRKYLPSKYKLVLYPTKVEKDVDINGEKINYFWRVKFDNIKTEVLAKRK